MVIFLYAYVCLEDCAVVKAYDLLVSC